MGTEKYSKGEKEREERGGERRMADDNDDDDDYDYDGGGGTQSGINPSCTNSRAFWVS